LIQLDASSNESTATSPQVEGVTDGVADEIKGDNERNEQHAGDEKVRRHDAE
jgi:hypothetical protein